MMSEWNKCNFCRWQSDWGCEAICENHDEYEPVIDRLIEKAHEKGISVQDVIALINYAEGR